MTDWLIVTGVAAAYLFVNLAIGLWPSRRGSKTVEGFVAGDRNFGTVLMYFVTGATMFSAFAFLGGPGWAFSRGMAALYIPAYGVLGIFPWFFLGVFAARVGRAHHFVTQGGMLAHRFQNRAVAVMAGLAGVLAMLPYIALQMQGAGIVLQTVTAGRIPVWLGAAVAYLVVLTYVWVSGLMGVGWTNAFQGMFMIVIAWVFGIYLPTRLYGGVGEMFQAIAQARPEMLTAPGLTANGQAWSWSGYSSAVLVSALGLMLWPHLFMKAFAARSDAVIRRSIALFPTFQIFLIPLFLVGMAGVLYPAAPTEADAIMPHMMMTSGLSPVLIGLFAAGALAASMSTGDALLHGAASMAIEDVGVNTVGRQWDWSDVDQRKAIRVSSIVIGVVGYIWAMLAHATDTTLVDLLLLAYGVIVQLLPGVYGAFLSRKLTGVGVAAGLAVGILTTGVFVVAPGWRPFGLHAGLIGLAANVIVTYGVSFLTTRPDLHIVNDWFAVTRQEDLDGHAALPLVSTAASTIITSS